MVDIDDDLHGTSTTDTQDTGGHHRVTTCTMVVLLYLLLARSCR